VTSSDERVRMCVSTEQVGAVVRRVTGESLVHNEIKAADDGESKGAAKHGVTRMQGELQATQTVLEKRTALL